MKVVFIDLDGVLVLEKWGTPNWDKSCINQFQRLVKETDTNLVLSSSWRHQPTLIYHFMELVGNLQIPIDSVIGMTPDIGLFKRDVEIEAFLDKRAHARMMLNPSGDYIKRWVILDDEPEFFNSPRCLNHLVLTNPKEGLTEDKCNEIISRLNS